MDQEGEDRGGEENNKQPQPQPQPHPPPPQPQQQQQQKCPRCDSLNTKFCYYNNYSLSQPRYFCKSCKRYWTQGGTLRNIPVGGSRKGKRGNKSSSSSSSSSSHKPYSWSQQPQPSISPHEVVQNQQSNLTTLVGPSPPTVVPPTNSPYSGGYLSSLAAVHSINPSSQSQPLNQSLNFGFNASDSLGSQHHQHSQILPPRFYHMGKVGSNLYPASQQGLIPSSMGSSSAAASHLDHGASDASLWSTISTTSISGNSDQSNIRGGSSSLIPNLHWPHLPGYDDPPE